MLKKIKIENIFGIKKPLEINFSLKDSKLKPNQKCLEYGVIQADDEPYMLTPTFIGKNAVKKSSVLNAIELITKIHMVGFEKWVEDKLHSQRWLLIKTERILHRIDRMIRMQRLNKERYFVTMDKKHFYRHIDNYLAQFNIENRISFPSYKRRRRNSIFSHDGPNKEYIVELIKNILPTVEQIVDKKFLNIKSSFILKTLNKISDNGTIVAEYNNNKVVKFSANLEEIEFSINNNNEYFSDFQYKSCNKIKNNLNKILDVIINDYIDEEDTKKKNQILASLHDGDQKTSFNKGKNIKQSQVVVSINDVDIRNSFNEEHYLNYMDCNDERLASNLLIKKTCEFYGTNFMESLLSKIDPSIDHIVERNGTVKAIDGETKNTNILSFGTQKIVYILNEIYPALKNGGIILIDEIENGFNIELIRILIAIFKDEDINVGAGQLIMTTHSPSIFNQEVVDPKQAILGNGENFIPALKLTKRTEDFISFFKLKNYYNSNYWKKFNTKEKIEEVYNFTNTLSNSDMNDILDKVKLK